MSSLESWSADLWYIKFCPIHLFRRRDRYGKRLPPSARAMPPGGTADDTATMKRHNPIFISAKKHCLETHVSILLPA